MQSSKLQVGGYKGIKTLLGEKINHINLMKYIKKIKQKFNEKICKNHLKNCFPWSKIKLACGTQS